MPLPINLRTNQMETISINLKNILIFLIIFFLFISYSYPQNCSSYLNNENTIEALDLKTQQLTLKLKKGLKAKPTALAVINGELGLVIILEGQENENSTEIETVKIKIPNHLISESLTYSLNSNIIRFFLVNKALSKNSNEVREKIDHLKSISGTSNEVNIGEYYDRQMFKVNKSTNESQIFNYPDWMVINKYSIFPITLGKNHDLIRSINDGSTNPSEVHTLEVAIILDLAIPTEQFNSIINAFYPENSNDSTIELQRMIMKHRLTSRYQIAKTINSNNTRITIPIEELLMDYFRLKNGKTSIKTGSNCLNCATNYNIKDNWNETHLDFDISGGYQDYTPTSSSEQKNQKNGDVFVLQDTSGFNIHALNIVIFDFIFSKDGQNLINPYRLVQAGSSLGQYLPGIYYDIEGHFTQVSTIRYRNTFSDSDRKKLNEADVIINTWIQEANKEWSINLISAALMLKRVDIIYDFFKSDITSIKSEIIEEINFESIIVMLLKESAPEILIDFILNTRKFDLSKLKLRVLLDALKYTNKKDLYIKIMLESKIKNLFLQSAYSVGKFLGETQDLSLYQNILDANILNDLNTDQAISFMNGYIEAMDFTHTFKLGNPYFNFDLYKKIIAELKTRLTSDDDDILIKSAIRMGNRLATKDLILNKKQAQRLSVDSINNLTKTLIRSDFEFYLLKSELLADLFIHSELSINFDTLLYVLNYSLSLGHNEFFYQVLHTGNPSQQDIERIRDRMKQQAGSNALPIVERHKLQNPLRTVENWLRRNPKDDVY
jgi:hypothetical protein